MKIYISIEDDLSLGQTTNLFQNLGAAFAGVSAVAHVGAEIGGTTTAAMEPEAKVLSITAQAVVNFLGGDSRYRMRTWRAIVKHFGVDCGEDEDALQEVIRDLIDDGRVTRRSRRSDGASLYQLV